jgi:hypothetical protein
MIHFSTLQIGYKFLKIGYAFLLHPRRSRDVDSSMKKLLNGGSIESACHNSYDKNQANGRINQLSILSSVIIPNFFLSLFFHTPSFFIKK